MSDLPSSEPTPEPAAVPAGERELDVDLAAFLPEGVELGDPGDDVDGAVVVDIEEVETVLDTPDGPVVVDETETVVETADEVIVVDEVVVATEDGVVVAQEVVAVAAEEPQAPPVDLEALSQIERDLDAVDAAIAALDAGTYGVDPATGQLLDDALLAEDPTRLS